MTIFNTAVRLTFLCRHFFAETNNIFYHVLLLLLNHVYRLTVHSFDDHYIFVLFLFYLFAHSLRGFFCPIIALALPREPFLRLCATLTDRLGGKTLLSHNLTIARTTFDSLTGLLFLAHIPSSLHYFPLKQPSSFSTRETGCPNRHPQYLEGPSSILWTPIHFHSQWMLPPDP